MKDGSLKFNISALFLIGILFTGYDLLPLFAPGILLFILFNKNQSIKNRILLIPIAIFAFVVPIFLIRLWLQLRGADLKYGNDDTYRIIINAYLNIFNQIPTWWGDLGKTGS